LYQRKNRATARRSVWCTTKRPERTLRMTTTNGRGPMSGRVVLVTGSNSGIGRETARELARMGARVLMHSRSRERGEEAVSDVASDALGLAPELVTADLASLAEVRALAAEVRERTDRLHVLVNNAGIIMPRRELSADGHERTFAVNHLAHFVLTHELLDLLRESTPARVVSVSSDAHNRGSTSFLDDVNAERSYRGLRVYGNSKLANLWFVKELAGRLAGTGVVANALHPGVVRTGLWRDLPAPLRAVLGVATRPFTLSPGAGAKQSITVASAPGIENVTGAYFAGGRQTPPSLDAQDPAAATRLWEISERLCGMDAT
jgi:NAD(P)-dependent dehydrogenase (short-subunit alcohol dehydrogenase family)